MKTIIKTILLGFFITSCLPLLHSQNKVSYGYDAAGNRISRTITMPALRSAPAPQPEEPAAVYSEMLSDIEVRIYPNPTDGLLKVEMRNLPEGQTAGIWIYSISGKQISAQREITGFAEMDISSHPPGTYLMKIVAGEYQTEWKIIKQ